MARVAGSGVFCDWRHHFERSSPVAKDSRPLPGLTSMGARSPLLNLLLAEVFLVRGDVPHVAERIFDRAAAIAVELIGHRADELGASRDGLFGEPVAVLDIQVQMNRAAAERCRAAKAHFRKLIS